MKKEIVRNWAYKNAYDPYGDLGITDGQNFGGYLGGILIARTSDYKPVGHIANARTYPFHVRYGIVESIAEQSADAAAVAEEVKHASLQLEIEGCRFIVSSGGKFGKYQKLVSDVVDLPTYMTPLMQLKWIQIALRSEESVLILSDLCQAEAKEVMEACGIGEDAYGKCVYIQTDPNTMDAGSLLENLAQSNAITSNNVKAVLLDTQVFAGKEELLKERFGVNVWTMNKLMRYVAKAVGQKPRHGFL